MEIKTQKIKIKVVCCVCRRMILNEKGEWVNGTFDEKKENNLSHGYCPECGEKVRKNYRLFAETMSDRK